MVAVVLLKATKEMGKWPKNLDNNNGNAEEDEEGEKQDEQEEDED